MSLAVLCPGQGAQHPAMFARVRNDAQAMRVIEAATTAAGCNIVELAGRPERYTNRFAQPLVCAGALAHWQALKANLPEPLVALGYSVGELAAHAVAGSFDATGCVSLAAERAGLMDAASPPGAGLLAVTGLRRDAVASLCERHGLAIAIVNGEDHYVLGGLCSGLQAAAETSAQAGGRATLLPVSLPAHTHWLQPAADTFARLLHDAGVQAPRLPVLAGLDGLPVTTAQRAIDTLAGQIARPLQWQRALAQAVERGARVFLELGPGGALAKMLRDAFPRCEARAVEDFSTLDGVSRWVEAACARAA